MNLENYGVIELHKDECQSINGGSWLSYAVGYVCGKIANAVDTLATRDLSPIRIDPISDSNFGKC